MGSQRGNNGVFDFWSEIAAPEEHEQQQQQNPSDIVVSYRRRRNERNPERNEQIRVPDKQNRLSLAAKKISWNRSLSMRGRTSIIISDGVDYQPPPRQKEAQNQKKPKPPVPRRKNVKPPSYDREKAYFQEVDSFELLEESPSPKNSGTWVVGFQNDHFVVPQINTRLGKWLVAKKLNYSCGPSSTLSNILETPGMPIELISSDASANSKEKTPERTVQNTEAMIINIEYSTSRDASVNSKEKTPERAVQITEAMIIDSIRSDASVTSREKTPEKAVQNTEAMITDIEDSEDICDSIQRLSLTQRLSLLDGDQRDSFASLLRVCKQSAPSTLFDLFSQYCDPGSIVKIGEGTFGEAFKAGATVCKIVPIDGDILVNGEVQKRSSELLEEVLLSWTLNSLKGQECHADNTCTAFIETIDVRVCRGSYNAGLIKAWEDWDAKHGSENDHPKEFSDKQCYVVFVLAHGGKDLESFVLLNFDEAQSLLVQVTAALAVAEAAYEFEHRDLHWGNILLARSGAESVKFVLEGRQMWARTFGLSISIIDFTLSRINTGEAIYFLDLSSDPELFKGPKGDKQSETYRKMKEVTEECWEGSFPKTNVLWLQYLVDILLLKKSFSRTPTDEKNLRSLKRRLISCISAKEAISDPFFSNLLLDHAL